MKRTLITTTFLVALGMALAGPPADVQLVCGEGEDAPIIGVASLVEDQLHLSVIAGALEACDDVYVYGVADGETVFTVDYEVADDGTTHVQVTFTDDPAYAPKLSYAAVPEVAVEGMLAAQRNRAAATERSAQAREHADDAPTDVPGDGALDRDRDRDRDQDPDGCDPTCDGDGPSGPPADLPAPANPGRP